MYCLFSFDKCSECPKALLKWRWNLEPSRESEVDDSSTYFTKMREASETDFCQNPLLVKQCVLLLKATRAIVWPIAKEALSGDFYFFLSHRFIMQTFQLLLKIKNALQKEEGNLGYIYSWLSVNHGRMFSKENRRFSFHGVVQKQRSLWRRDCRGGGASGNHTPQL